MGVYSMSAQRTKSNKKFMILSAIGIFMVVDSHTFTCFNILGNFMPYNSFFMPMFVFISGYFNKVDSSTKLWPYFIKKVRSLLVPYTGISLAVFGIQQLINWIKLGDEMTPVPQGYFAYVLDRVVTVGSFGAIAEATWFVISLFVTLMVYAILKKLLHGIWNSYVMLALFTAAHIFVVYLAKNTDPQYLTYLLVPLKCLFLMPFLEMGVIYRNHIEKKHESLPAGFKIGLMFALLVVNAVRTLYLPNAYDLAFDRINDLSGFYSPYYVTPLISSIVGILFWLTFVDLIAKPVGESRFVNYMSCNTFWIMGFHILFFNIVNCILMLISRHIAALPCFDIESFMESEWYFWEIGNNAKILYVLAGVLGPLLFKWIFDKISSPVRNKYNGIKSASEKNAKILSGVMYALLVVIFAGLVIIFVGSRLESASDGNDTEVTEDIEETFSDDETGYVQDQVVPAYAFLDIVYEEGGSNADYYSVPVEVYGDGTYTITVKRSEDASAELAFAGLSYMGIKLIRELNDDTADIDISNAEITNITVSCDGMPLVVIDNGETISINEGDRYVYFDCYDKDSGVTSTENADESKAFKFDGKNEIEVTFMISGISTR
ncbi:MAG: acyltransferase [Lachnospiraceae bacterium]|nr:acyltransferase [Lachnospiraceae bacterium]